MALIHANNKFVCDNEKVINEFLRFFATFLFKN